MLSFSEAGGIFIIHKNKCCNKTLQPYTINHNNDSFYAAVLSGFLNEELDCFLGLNRITSKNSEITVSLGFPIDNLNIINSNIYLVVNSKQTYEGRVCLDDSSKFQLLSKSGFNLHIQYVEHRIWGIYNINTAVTRFDNYQLKKVIKIYNRVKYLSYFYKDNDEFQLEEEPLYIVNTNERKSYYYHTLRLYEKIKLEQYEFVCDFIKNQEGISFFMLEKFIKKHFFEIYAICNDLKPNELDINIAHISKLNSDVMNIIIDFICGDVLVEQNQDFIDNVIVNNRMTRDEMVDELSIEEAKLNCFPDNCNIL